MDGILNVYKEKGYTSFAVVARLRGILHQKKIGHTGTLDPDAEGVLPVCLGRATKVCDFIMEKDKTYRTVLHLGITTDTQDSSGTILKTSEEIPDETKIREMIQAFIGKIEQIPPMYSAVKVNGKKLCDLARKGVEIERKSRTIEIYDIRILKIELPLVTMEVDCSKGTYIRTLCHDIGEQLGCGGCMDELLRVKTGGFELSDAHTLEMIAKAYEKHPSEHTEEEDGFLDYLIPIDQVLLDYPSVSVIPEADIFLHSGNRIPFHMILSEDERCFQGRCRMYYSTGVFCGLYEYYETAKEFRAVKVFG